MNRAEKAHVIEQLKNRAETATIALVTDFRGMSVEEMTDLRAKFREVGVDYQVVKNTLARMAMSDTWHSVLSDRFKDTNAVAWGYEDPVIAAKTLVDFAKGSKKLAIRHGSLRGNLIDEATIKDLASLPSRPELLAKTLGTMNAVPTNFVSLFGNLLRNFLYALNAIKDQKEA